jgi:hypothetical protein
MIAMDAPDVAPQWCEVEFVFQAEAEVENPYLEVDMWINFRHEEGEELRRPAFWDGSSRWCVRFASTLPEGTWEWESHATGPEIGLDGLSGSIEAVPSTDSENRFRRHGFWGMGPSGRNLVHADGTSAVLVADTPWALPWRATPEQARIYARDRQEKGFNAALLMSLQPDRYAEGPMDRTQDYGFDVAFTDLPEGRLTRLRPEYFQKMDRLMQILVDHEIVPVYNPVFHGYGWKGKSTAGNAVPPEEYARYCRYLVARYGARPALWLVMADGYGEVPAVEEGGKAFEEWDAYRHPTGLHYGPATDSSAFQEAEWLDFQWCQTGHYGDHMPERVAAMWHNRPVKAVANGEPTYERIGSPGNAVGWWQGKEAWGNLVSGGTMGVVYGAASLWQWRLHKEEPGHADWAMDADAGWREALDFEGSRYVGIVGKLLDGLPLEGMRPDPTLAHARGVLHAPGRMVLVYLPSANSFTLYKPEALPPVRRTYDLKTGKLVIGPETWDSSERYVHCGPAPSLTLFLNE